MGVIEDICAVFGRSYAAAPDRFVNQLRVDETVAKAGALLLRDPGVAPVARRSGKSGVVLIRQAAGV